MNAGTTYAVFAFSDSSSGDTATPSSTTLGSPTFTATGSEQSSDTSADHDWAWYVTGGSSNQGPGTITLTFAKATTQAYVEDVQLVGTTIATPAVTSNEAFAVSSTSNTSATANLSSVSGTADGELIFFSGAASAGASAPTSSSSAIGNLVHSSDAGSEGVYFGAPPQASETLTMGTATFWGTIALEINE